jgi:hypothetical protein
MADRTEWQSAVESELRALGRELEVPPASDLTAVVRQRLEGRVSRLRHPPVWRFGARRRRPAWHAALVVAVSVLVLLAVLIATPQGRAVISHVLRFAGIELRQGPGPVRSPGVSASLPGQRRMSLETARRHVSFPILVPAALGRPREVVVSDDGRVATLIYRRPPYGRVLLDEFAGQLDRVFFEKFVHFSDVRRVEVNGVKGLWIKGPQVLMYINRDGKPAMASARLTTGNTLIWATRQVALRLEGNFGKKAALGIADSAH